MNQSRSIYKSDYVPYDWMQNNFASNTADFCSLENIDDCLHYISQEFSALGYPPVYTNTNNCAFAVNCDIVQLLNVTFDLLGNCRDNAQVKEDLDSRNCRLFADLNAANKKNSQLKESLEQTERKYKTALEKERQLKEKNKDLLVLLKSEKEETKRLSSQIHQQKVAYQHEIRKYENNTSQMKSRLNQILADKNPEKKIANISPSNLLQRNSKLRGKWKTGSVAKSCVEEMYSSVISSYENRCQEMLREISGFHSCLEYIQSQMFETVTVLQGEVSNSSVLSSTLSSLQAIWSGTDMQKGLEERFAYLLGKIREVALRKVDDNSQKYGEEVQYLKSRLSKYEKILQDCKLSGQVLISEKDSQDLEQNNPLSSDCCTPKEELEAERESLNKEKSELAATISLIAKEKADLEVRKLEMIKMAMRQEVPKAQWHQNLNTISSFSVITTKEGLTAVPCASQLKNCLSTPNQQVNSLTPLWKSEGPRDEGDMGQKSTSETTIKTAQSTSPLLAITVESHQNTGSADSGLPKWAITAMNSLSLSTEAQPSQNETTVLNSTSNEELELSTVSSSEEQNLLLLQSAMEDIENRRKQVSM